MRIKISGSYVFFAILPLQPRFSAISAFCRRPARSQEGTQCKTAAIPVAVSPFFRRDARGAFSVPQPLKGCKPPLPLQERESFVPTAISPESGTDGVVFGKAHRRKDKPEDLP